MQRLRLAVDLAIRNGSRLAALYVRGWNQAQLDQRKAAELGLVPARAVHRWTSASRPRSTPRRRADLIVAGASGHPRMWEKLLGGVTDDPLANLSLPDAAARAGPFRSGTAPGVVGFVERPIGLRDPL